MLISGSDRFLAQIFLLYIYIVTMSHLTNIFRYNLGNVGEIVEIVQLTPILYFLYVLNISGRIRIQWSPYLNPAKSNLTQQTPVKYEDFDICATANNDACNLEQFEVEVDPRLRLKMVTSFWHHIVAIIFWAWTYPQIVATDWLMKATFRETTDEKERRYLHRWKNVQVLYLNLELGFIGFSLYCLTVNFPFGQSAEEYCRKFLIEVIVFNMFVFISFVTRLAFMCSVMYYQMLKSVLRQRVANA